MNQRPDSVSASSEKHNGHEIRIDPELVIILTEWYASNARPLPWRKDCDPYRVWVSEIMLQQTRAEVVCDYFIRFTQAFPCVESLARADVETVMKQWEGLGYYSRARNLHKAAKQIVTELGGSFPDTHAGLLALPGIGAYTAGAIASICYDLPCAAVDGNVLRIISRIAGIAQAIDAPRVKREIAAALEKIYPEERRGDFTQGLMEIGATVCLPNGSPACAVCPVQKLCFAYQNGAVSRYPIKSAKKERRFEKRIVLLLAYKGRIALRRRDGQGLLAGLWELPNVPGEPNAQAALDLAAMWGTSPITIVKSITRTHIFTHIKWEMTCYYIDCAVQARCFVWADRAALEKTYALPRAFKMFIDEPNVYGTR